MTSIPQATNAADCGRPAVETGGSAHSPGLRPRHWVVLGVLLALILGVFGVVGYFRLSSPTQALRGSVVRAVGGPLEKKFAVHVGALTMSVARVAGRWLNVPPEPQAVLDTLHGGEVGVYKLEKDAERADLATVFSKADAAMRARGWERTVGLAEGERLVAVYLPRSGISARSVSCCLMVLQGRQLIVGSVRGNARPLLELAERHLSGGGNGRGLALR